MRKVNNLKAKGLLFLLIIVLQIIMMSINVFATENVENTSCDEEIHDFSIKKYDENNHWNECSVCGVVDKHVSHYYDEKGDITCNGCSYEREIVEYISIDKNLMSEGETATITVKVIDGYTAEWIYFYKPITNNIKTVFLYLDSDNTYTGTFKVDDQTESGIWKVKNLTLKNVEDEYSYLYNSNTYTDSYYDKYDFSSLNFEVIGTEADVSVPIIESYSIDKATVSVGEKVTVTVQVTDDHLPTRCTFCFKSPSNESEYIFMEKVDDTGLYHGIFSVDENCEIGVWKPYYFSVSDTNDNSTKLYNSKVTAYGSNNEDLSALNFEVIEIKENEDTEKEETFIVIFKDGYGNTLSTQRVNKGETAVEPETPTNELYLFNGWDTDFTNITSSKIINATWILKPDVVYDEEAHIGKTFTIKVYSTASQDYTISCNEDIEFSSNLISISTIVSNKVYYAKEYEIRVNKSGSYLFYVEGSKSSNILTYKVKITEHDFESEWTIKKEATCTGEGSKYHKCTICEVITDVTEIEKLGHNYSEEWMIDKEATCTEEGSKSHHCIRCDEKTDITTIEKLGHNYSEEWTIDKEATCTEEGSKSHHCIRCDEKTDITTIEKLGHSYSEEWTIDKEATCTEDGSKSHHCNKCDSVTEVTLIEAKGHNLSKVDKQNATCDCDGYIRRSCLNCNYVENTLIEATGHTISNTAIISKKATTSNNGLLSYKCTKCGTIVKKKTVLAVSTVKLSNTAYSYDGKKKTPSIIIKDKNGNTLVKNTDYILSSWKCETGSSATARKAIGKYYITITFKGKYSGTKKLSFTIGPKKPKNVNVVLTHYYGYVLSWYKVSGATGYKIYWKPSPENQYTYFYTKSTNCSFCPTKAEAGKKATLKVVAYKTVNGIKCYNEGVTCSIYTLKKVSGVKVVKSGSKVKVSWTNIPGETGYQISQSTNKNGTNIVATYKTTTGTYKTISATKGKTYYYKVRAYKLVNEKKIYAPWSTAVKYVRK